MNILESATKKQKDEIKKITDSLRNGTIDSYVSGAELTQKQQRKQENISKFFSPGAEVKGRGSQSNNKRQGVRPFLKAAAACGIMGVGLVGSGNDVTVTNTGNSAHSAPYEMSNQEENKHDTSVDVFDWMENQLSQIGSGLVERFYSLVPDSSAQEAFASLLDNNQDSSFPEPAPKKPMGLDQEAPSLDDNGGFSFVPPLAPRKPDNLGIQSHSDAVTFAPPVEEFFDAARTHLVENAVDVEYVDEILESVIQELPNLSNEETLYLRLVSGSNEAAVLFAPSADAYALYDVNAELYFVATSEEVALDATSSADWKLGQGEDMPSLFDNANENRGYSI